MSEKVARLAVAALRSKMFPQLPKTVQDLFPQVSDPLVQPTEQVPNIIVGEYQDQGAGAALPMVTVHCEGAAEGIVNVYRHITMHVDIWVSAAQTPNVDARRIISTIYEYVFKNLENTNWSGQDIQIERSYEIERSAILFEPQNKIYHISNAYRVEALSKVWY
jgi:hypothetical protein